MGLLANAYRLNETGSLPVCPATKLCGPGGGRRPGLAAARFHLNHFFLRHLRLPSDRTLRESSSPSNTFSLIETAKRRAPINKPILVELSNLEL